MSVRETWQPDGADRIHWAIPVMGPLIAAIAYYAGAEIAFGIGTLTLQFAPFWPPNVVLLCALLLAPRRHWPFYIAAAFPAHVLAEQGVAMPLAQLVIAFASNVAVAVLNAVLLRQGLRGPTWLGSLRNGVLYLLIAVIAAPAFVAFWAAIEPTFAGAPSADYWHFWWRWYLSNALGSLTLTPLFLAWVWDQNPPPNRPLRSMLIEAALLATGLMVCTVVVFDARFLAATKDFLPALLYLPIPFLLAAAVRFGSRGASGAILIVTIAVLFRVMRGNGPFASDPPGDTVLAVQLFLAVIAVPTILVASLIEELRRTVAERTAAESGAQATRRLLQSSLDALTSQFAILDGSGRILAVNSAWQHAADLVAECGEHYFVGENFIEIAERARPHQRVMAAGLRRLTAGEIKEFHCEYSSDFVAGRSFQMRGTRFGSGVDLRLVVAHEDITEIKASEETLRDLTARLLRLQDDERRRIARELHDSTAQNLLGATLGIGQALRIVPGLKLAAKAALEESRALIDQAQREIRTVSYLLHPPMLDEAGLPAALRWLCEGFAKRTEIRVQLDVAPGPDRLPAEIEAALFRIAQEGLTNVHRHSGGTSVRVGLIGNRASNVTLTIEDNGNGMPVEIVDPTLARRRSGRARAVGIGLAGMRERLHQFGGRLDIRSGEQGTTVCATVPMSAYNEPVSDTSRVEPLRSMPDPER